MSDRKRPGGLTALAVLNFVFGGLGAILSLFVLTAGGMVDVAASEAAAQGADVTAEVSDISSLLYVAGLLGLISAALLITSGVGYLGQKKFLGRTLGNVYAVLSIGSSVIGIAAGGGVGIGTIIGLIYPVLTLILLNTTFKEDFVN